MFWGSSEFDWVPYRAASAASQLKQGILPVPCFTEAVWLLNERPHGLKRRLSSAWVKNVLASQDLVGFLQLPVFALQFLYAGRFCRRDFMAPYPAPQRLGATADLRGDEFNGAAHCKPCSALDSNTLRTARSFTSGENFVVFFMVARSFQDSEPP